MIKATGLIKSYGSLQVLKGVDISVDRGEIISIVGASGAGKSTLLHILGSLDRPDAGEVKIFKEDIFSLKETTLAAFRNKHMGFVFQFHHLLPEFTALENICMPGFIAGKNDRIAQSRAMDLLDYFGLKERAQHKPNELSGGEQQRVAVARSLMNNPDIIFADEPSGNLDSESAKQLHTLFINLRQEFNITFVIVTHNTELAEMADRKLVMKDGFIISQNQVAYPLYL